MFYQSNTAAALPFPYAVMSTEEVTALEELILDNLREIVSFARQHKERFIQMVMDMDLKERNKGLSKRKKLLSDAERRIKELDVILSASMRTTFPAS